MENYNEEDLDRLIEEKLEHCEDNSNVCQFIKTPTGKDRVRARIRQIVFDTGIANIDTAIGIVETELIWEGDND